MPGRDFRQTVGGGASQATRAPRSPDAAARLCKAVVLDNSPNSNAPRRKASRACAHIGDVRILNQNLQGAATDTAAALELIQHRLLAKAHVAIVQETGFNAEKAASMRTALRQLVARWAQTVCA